MWTKQARGIKGDFSAVAEGGNRAERGVGRIRMGRDPSSIHPGKEGTPLPSSELELCSTERRRQEL